MHWQPIASYDALAEKPRYCVFWVAAEINKERPYASNAETITTTRIWGSRNVTHWMEVGLPLGALQLNPPKPTKKKTR